MKQLKDCIIWATSMGSNFYELSRKLKKEEVYNVFLSANSELCKTIVKNTYAQLKFVEEYLEEQERVEKENQKKTK